MKPAWIRHRVNRIADLKSLQRGWGAEIDLRAQSHAAEHKIYLAHDPWIAGEDFESWLDEYARLGLRGPIALNTKEDALENRIYELLAARNLTNFFFVDTAAPTLIKQTLGEAHRQFSVRLSRYEPVASVQNFVGKADWIWVDCFDAKPLDAEKVRILAKKFKICLVSPELQGGKVDDARDFKALFELADAVCTKDPLTWQKIFNVPL